MLRQLRPLAANTYLYQVHVQLICFVKYYITDLSEAKMHVKETCMQCIGACKVKAEKSLGKFVFFQPYYALGSVQIARNKHYALFVNCFAGHVVANDPEVVFPNSFGLWRCHKIVA